MIGHRVNISFRLAIVSLFTFYMNLYFVHKKSLEALANGDIVIVDANK